MHDAGIARVGHLAKAGSGLRSRSIRFESEPAFAALGAIMGIDPDVPNSYIETLPRLSNEVQWVRLPHLPVEPNEIVVEHRRGSTIFTNQSGPPLTWRPAFLANGKRIDLPALTVRAGETRTAKAS